MKLYRLTPTQLKNAPDAIKYLCSMAYNRMPVGSKIIKDIEKLYPEYFINEKQKGE